MFVIFSRCLEKWTLREHSLFQNKIRIKKNCPGRARTHTLKSPPSRRRQALRTKNRFAFPTTRKAQKYLSTSVLEKTLHTSVLLSELQASSTTSQQRLAPAGQDKCQHSAMV